MGLLPHKPTSLITVILYCCSFICLPSCSLKTKNDYPDITKDYERDVVIAESFQPDSTHLDDSLSTRAVTEDPIGLIKLKSKREKQLVVTDTMDLGNGVLKKSEKDTIYYLDYQYERVKVEKLIRAFQLKVTMLNLPKGDHPIGKLLRKTLDIRTQKEVDSYYVEIWHSPLNYRGYKRGKNKLILYGLSEDDELTLFGYKKNLYLQKENIVYKLRYTEKHKAYTEEIDTAILNKIFNRNDHKFF